VLPSVQQQQRPWMQYHATSATGSLRSSNSQTRLISPWSPAAAAHSHSHSSHSHSHSHSHSQSHRHNYSSESVQAAAYGGVEEYSSYPQYQPEQQQQQQYQTQAGVAPLNQTRNLSYRSVTSGSHYSSATSPTAATMGSVPPTPRSASGTEETVRGLPTPTPTSAHRHYSYANRTTLPPAYSSTGPSDPDSPSVIPHLPSSLPVLQQVQAPSRAVVERGTFTSPTPPPVALQPGRRPSQLRRDRSKSSTPIAGMSKPAGKARAMERLSTLRLHQRNNSTMLASPDSDEYSSGDDKTLVGSLPRKSGFYAAGALRSPPPPVPILRLVQ
jgi:hypothetical protein